MHACPMCQLRLPECQRADKCYDLDSAAHNADASIRLQLHQGLVGKGKSYV